MSKKLNIFSIFIAILSFSVTTISNDNVNVLLPATVIPSADTKTSKDGKKLFDKIRTEIENEEKQRKAAAAAALKAEKEREKALARAEKERARAEAIAAKNAAKAARASERAAKNAAAKAAKNANSGYTPSAVTSTRSTKNENVKLGQKRFKEIQNSISNKQQSTSEPATVVSGKQGKRGKKRFKEIQNDIAAPLEDIFFKEMKTTDNVDLAARKAFIEGNDRLAVLRLEETEIRNLEKAAGIPISKKAVLSGDKFDEVQKKFEKQNQVSNKLLSEKEALEAQLEALNRMQNALKQR